MAITVAALAEWLDGQVLGNEMLMIDRAHSLSKAGPGSISFFAGTKVAGLKPVEGAAILIARELSVVAAPLVGVALPVRGGGAAGSGACGKGIVAGSDARDLPAAGDFFRGARGGAASLLADFLARAPPAEVPTRRIFASAARAS